LLFFFQITFISQDFKEDKPLNFNDVLKSISLDPAETTEFPFKTGIAFRMYHFGVLVLQKKQTEPASLSQAKRKKIPHDSAHPSKLPDRRNQP
jgi:hypothetical protein